ncbi:MAG: peptide ABC transporter permease [Peptococcaceae bacterium BRH_c4b]|nr:MAG: peptide ABC transporter permease [Peptococcaceae bacterium BRH_c4b]
MSATVNTEAAVEQEKNSPFGEVWQRFKKNRIAMASLILLVTLTLLAILAPLVTSYDPYVGQLPQALKGPSASHIMGTDELGRDIYTRIIYGARISLWVGLLAVAVALAAGTILGSLAAYYGRWADNLIMRFMDIMLAIPSLLLVIAFMMVLGKGIENAIIAIGIVSVPEYVRIVRSSVLAVKENDYVQAARAIGNRDLAIIARHILPNITTPVIVKATLGISTAILDTAALGFLGLGVQPPYAEWGTMLGVGRNCLAPHIVFFPGLAITVTVLAFNLLGDGLRDALDPRLKC